MTTLYLVRHGESLSNRDATFTGQTNAPLTEKGELQALRAANALRNKGISHVYASDLKRAYRTGEIIAETLRVPITPDVRLREINGGDWHGMTFDDIAAKYPDLYEKWKDDLDAIECPHGESIRDVRDRFRDAAEKLARQNDGKTILIATHACPIRALKSVAIGRPMQSFSWCPNASYTVMTYENGVFTLTEDGICDYLEDIKTTLSTKI